MVRKSGQSGVPVIVVDDQVVVGFDQARLEQLLAVAPRRAVLGAAVADAQKYPPGAAGAYVGLVRPGSAAQRAGLLLGDVIVQLGDRPVRSASDVEYVIGGMAPGAKVSVEWLRDGERMRGEAAL